MGGRLFTFVVLVFGLGLGIVALPTGPIASALTKAREMDRKAMAEPRPKSKSRSPSSLKASAGSRASRKSEDLG